MEKREGGVRGEKKSGVKKERAAREKTREKRRSGKWEECWDKNGER